MMAQLTIIHYNYITQIEIRQDIQLKKQQKNKDNSFRACHFISFVVF